MSLCVLSLNACWHPRESQEHTLTHAKRILKSSFETTERQGFRSATMLKQSKLHVCKLFETIQSFTHKIAGLISLSAKIRVHKHSILLLFKNAKHQACTDQPEALRLCQEGQ